MNQKALTLPAETYRATYRGTTMVLAHANHGISRPVAERLAKDIEWMREGDISVRLHTLHQSARHELSRHIPSDVFEPRDAALQTMPQMIEKISSDGQGRIEELIVLSKMQGIRNGNGRIMPLLSDTKIPEVRSAHADQKELLDALELGLVHVPKIVVTAPQFLGEEISSVTGRGTMAFDRDATTYGPMFKREEPIFRENYDRNARDGTYRQRGEAELQKAMDTHHCIRAGKSIIGGFSLNPQGRNRLSLELVWGCSRGGDLGSLILDHATEEAAESAYYSMTVRQAIAGIFGAYPGMQDLGTISSLKKSGEIERYAPEHKDYDTTHRDPHVFWHEGKR